MLDCRSKLGSASVLGLVVVLTSSSCVPDWPESPELELCDPDVSTVSMTALVEETSVDITASAHFDFADSPCETNSVWVNGVLAESSNDGEYHYVKFDTIAEDHEYVFEYYRAGREEPVVARVTLPDGINITSPVSTQKVSLPSGFGITWGPALGGLLEVDIEPVAPEEVLCVDAPPWVVQDSGFYQVPGSPTIDENTLLPDECRMQIILQRINVGDYPSEFAPGQITAHRYGKVTVTPSVFP